MVNSKSFQQNELSEDPLVNPGLNPDPEELISDDTIDHRVLKKLCGQSVLSARQFDLPLIREICKFAALLEATEIASSHPLDGNIIITAFYEASTRTRLSFESSVLRLDGKVLSIADASITGVAKEESLEDMGEMFNAYGDLVIMRHTETNSINQLQKNLRLPLINAGNGSGEHPTQALADWYAILKWKPQLKEKTVSEEEKIHLGILGTPGSMRAVKSFLLMAVHFKHAIKKITIVSEMADPLGDALTKEIDEIDQQIEIHHDIQEVLEDLDVIYMNSIAFLGDSYKKLDSRHKLNKKSQIKKDAVILHPFARLDELSKGFDKTDHNLYFAQAHGATFIRQALLIAVLNRFDRLPKSIPVKWEN